MLLPIAQVLRIALVNVHLVLAKFAAALEPLDLQFGTLALLMPEKGHLLFLFQVFLKMVATCTLMDCVLRMHLRSLDHCEVIVDADEVEDARVLLLDEFQLNFFDHDLSFFLDGLNHRKSLLSEGLNYVWISTLDVPIYLIDISYTCQFLGDVLFHLEDSVNERIAAGVFDLVPVREPLLLGILRASVIARLQLFVPALAQIRASLVLGVVNFLG